MPPLKVLNCALPPVLLSRNVVVPPALVLMMALPAVDEFSKFNAPVLLAEVPTLNVGVVVVD